MSLLGKLFSRFRKPVIRKERARRLFLEPLEGRRLLAVDLQTTKVADISPAVAGEQFSYTITVTNLGPGSGGGADEAAVNVILQDVIPVGTTYIDLQAPGGWSVTPPPTGEAGEPVSATIDVLNIDEPQTFTLFLNVLPDARGTVINEAGVSTDSNELDPTNDSSGQIETPIEVRADLSINKTDNIDQVDAGGVVTYTITVTNSGPSDVLDAVISDVFPTTTLSNVTFSSTAQGGASGNTANGAGNINDTVDMPVGSTIIYTVTATAGSAGVITNTATVTPPAGTIDPDNNDNSSTDTTTILGTGPTTDLQITKTDGSATAIPGGTVTYTIVVTNAGPQAITGATVTDTFPAAFTGVQYTSVAAGGASGNTDAGGGNIADTVSLPVGSTITYTVIGTLSASATGTLSNTATVTLPDGANDSNPNNNSATDTNTLTPQADLAITKTDSPAASSSIPGTPITYTIVVSNPTGPSNITGAAVTDTFPGSLTNVTFTSTTTGGASGNTNGNGNINNTVSLPVGSSITYTVLATISPSATGPLTNTATVDIGTADPNPGNNSATDTNTLVPTADLSVVKSNATTTVTPGGPISYTIVVTNSGPSAVTGATVSDTFPAQLTGVTYTSVTTGGATGNTADGAGNISDIVNLPSGATITYTVNATVSNLAAGTITNTATVQAPGGVTDPTPGNNTDSETDSVPSVDLAISKSDNVTGPVTAGENITYTITVSNPGTFPLDGVVLTDSVPANTSLVSLQVPSGWTRTDTVQPGGTGQLRVTRAGSLAASASEVFTLVVRVNPGAPNNANIVNTAAVTTTTAGDVNPNNNSAQETTPVQTRADVSLTKTDAPDPVGAGGLITYTINVLNNGPSNATSLTLTDVIPTGTTFQSLTAPGWSFAPPAVGGTGTITATNPSLAPGATSNLTLVVRVNTSLDSGASISNTASVSATTTDPNPGNNSDTETTTVIVPPDFGDAPDSYGTLIVSNGPRHGIGTLRLGTLADSEPDGQPTDNALGDDLNGEADEDGVIVPGALIVNRPAAVIANASAEGRLDAWIDFNRNGAFDANEQIATSLLVSPGDNTIFFTVPADAVVGDTFARFRLSSAGGLGPTGPSPDGEVEDYATSIITVTPGTVGIVPDPELPGQNMLLIVGTAGNDNISVTQLRTHRLKVQVTMNHRNRGTFNMANFRRIAVFAGAGNDTVKIGLARPALILGEEGNDRLTGHGGFDSIFGGPGNDIISGGGGDDLLVGGDGNDRINGDGGNDILLGGLGNDTLSGGAGRDLLLGGLGADSLGGGSGDDILIGGTTTFDENRAALAQIMAAWTTKEAFHTRVNNLGPIINSSTVGDDGSRDRLDGGAERDWYLDYLLADTVIGFNPRQDRKN